LAALLEIDTVAVAWEVLRLVVLDNETPETCIVGATTEILSVVEPVLPFLSRT
jgi:hypothetical protein